VALASSMFKITNQMSICLRPEDWTETIALEKVFNRPKPELEVDIGSGKGRFLIARAGSHKDTCFIGIDRVRTRILKLERKILRQGLENVRLLFSEASYAVGNLLPDESVSVYYLFFSDPWPKRRHHRRRLFNADFLAAIRRTLRPGGFIHAATDHLDYFAIIKQSLSSDTRFAEAEPFVPAAEERTDFELTFLSQMKPIGRCSFMKKKTILSQKSVAFPRLSSRINQPVTRG